MLPPDRELEERLLRENGPLLKPPYPGNEAQIELAFRLGVRATLRVAKDAAERAGRVAAIQRQIDDWDRQTPVIGATTAQFAELAILRNRLQKAMDS